MKVAILSAGPLLVHTFNPDARYDLRIGVNRAVGSYHCDWWSAGDAQTFAEHRPIGHPVLFTMTDTDGQFRRYPDTQKRLSGHRMVLWGECCTALSGQGMPGCWSNWSITAALALAVWQGAQHVDVFGHYYEGEDPNNCTDVSGRRIEKRIEQRPRVLRDWKRMVEWAVDQQGSTVAEHLPEEALCT